jgi:photosystem II stability/assembly factor-like uncharacterized protein
MKRKLLLLPVLVIIMIASLSYAQLKERNSQAKLTRDKSLFPLQSTGIWTEVHPLIPRVAYFGVHFTNKDTGWAVGEGGAIIKTTNGGGKWKWFESGVENTLKTVYSINNGQRVIAAGDGGIILISENGGEKWNTLSSGTAENIWNMQMITEDIGWMVGEGSTALKTTDGGLTWNQQQTPFTTLPYWDINFVDINYGYIACNSATILKTTNGGLNWQIQTAGDYRDLYTIYAFDTLKAIAGGFAGKIVLTTNGGNNWTQLQNLSGNGTINRIKFFDSLNGFLVTTVGSFQTTDGGYTWTYNDALYNNYITWNIDFPNVQNGYIVGDKMFLMKTTDAGINWNQTIVKDYFINVYFKDEQNGFINSSKKIYKTTDGGATLSVLESFPYNEIYSFDGMLFTDSLTGYIGTTPTRIYKTIDGGESWHRTNITGLSDTIGVIRKIFFITSDIGWAIKGNQIMKTTDSGENWWVQQDIPGSVESIFFIDSLVGWSTNTVRLPYKTSDGGNTWTEQVNSNIQLSRDLFFKNYEEGYIDGYMVGTGLGIYRTFDGGLTWSRDSSFSELGFTKFSNYDSDNIFLTGDKVYRTTNEVIIGKNLLNCRGRDWKQVIFGLLIQGTSLEIQD